MQLDHDVSRAKLGARLDILDVDVPGWAEIAPCRDCGQIWRLDVPDKRVELAIKAPSVGGWSPEADRAARMVYLRRARGGESSALCMLAECPNRVLKGMAICAEHAYAASLTTWATIVQAVFLLDDIRRL